MAKPSKPQNSASPSLQPSAGPALAHTSKLAHPEEMSAILTTMELDGWQLITIVHCRHSNEHAAYFRRRL